MMRRRNPSTMFLIAFLLLLQMSNTCSAKKISGNFQLSGRQTEVVLGSFAVIPTGARFELSMIAYGQYDTPDSVMVRAYRDTEWDIYQKELLCTDKTKHAHYETPLKFMNRQDGTYQVYVRTDISEFDPKTNLKSERNHYWYFVVDDCSLELYYHDNRIPKMHYELSMKNSYGAQLHSDRFSEMSADDKDLLPVR
jgi:hypothetical protein